MFRPTAYETTACKGFIIEPLKEAVLHAIIQGNLHPHPNNPDLRLVQGGYLVDETIKSFLHPLAVPYEDAFQIAVDVRTAGKFDLVNNGFAIRDKESYDGICLRGHLTDLWVNHSPDPLRNFSPLPLELYSSWLAERIAKRLGLEAKAQAQVHILAAIFYLNNFWKDEPADKLMMKSQITRATRMNDLMVSEVLEQRHVISDLADFCVACQEVTQSQRFKHVDAGILLQIIGGDWYGAHKEIIAVALEHPPTWLGVIWEGFNNRGMRNSGLAQILERNSYRRQKDLFTNALLNLALV